MKILIVSDSFPKNNFDGIFVYKRLLQFAEKGIEFKVIKPKICLRKNLKLDFEKDYEITNDGLTVPVTVINCIRVPGSYKLIGFNSRITKIVKEFNPDIIHCHFIWNAYNVLKCFKNNKFPIFLTAHGSDIHTFPKRSSRLRKQTEITLKKAEISIFVSEFLLRKAEEIAGDNKKFYFIPNGIDSYFLNKKRTNPYEDIGKNIIYVGRLENIKRVDLLPEILSDILNFGFNVKMHIVGNGSKKEIIETKAKALNIQEKIVFYGRVEHEDLPDLLVNKDCLLLISENEGWPCVVLEAQACGVPVVGTSNGGIPEAIGDGGIVIEDNDVTGNAVKALTQILNNPMSSDSLKERATRFTWKKIVEKEIELYINILNNANRNT